MSIAKFHADWLNLLEVDGPFLTLPVLTERLRSGLEPTDPELVAELHTAQREVEDDPTLQPVWIRWVITRLLGFPDEVLREGAAIGPNLIYRVAEHSQTLRPDFAVVEQADDGTERARLIVNVWPAGTNLDERPAGERWAVTPIDRTAELCRATTVRLGLVTNGDTWTLVDAPVDATTGTATWDATLWFEERTTLDAFVTLLGVRRFFTVADNETLEALLAQSANAEAEVTDQLGKQVRAAVELLVDAMSRADRERGGAVFRDLRQAELDQDLEPYIYEAAVTVLMRLVFLLSAEERGLFLLGDPTYDASYAVSTLLAQLEEDANRYGEDVLERRTDAWHRLLATFRMVHAGAAHANLRLPPYGGSLFDPDRFPFLEGRRLDWPTGEQPTPLRIDNRTVKHILDALQVLRFRGKGGWQEARRLSFRTLGVEQIGHVYEGLLDHGVVQVSAEAVALNGKNEPEVALELVEEVATKGTDALIKWLADLTGDKPTTIEKGLAAVPEPDQLDRLASACDNDPALATRVAPYLGLLRNDLRDLPQVYLPDSYYVTKSSDRRSSGAYYTPRVLAEEIVGHTLEPLVYSPGPADGVDPSAWKLKSSLVLLDLRVCDMAMGSGAFLVSACRYLSERLLEAWASEGFVPSDLVPLPGGASTPLPDDATDREILARRLVVDRCLYGVDRNPMAVEMAKLSLWLITLAKDRPFTFVDHALRCGDSLLGVTDLRQLDSFHLDPVSGRALHGGTLFDPATRIEPILKAALEKRRQLESFTVIDIHDAERKRRLFDESNGLLDQLRVIGDLVVGAALATATAKPDEYGIRLLSVVDDVMAALDPDRDDDDRRARLFDLSLRATYWLDEGRPPLTPARHALHWVLEFPEVFLDRFDAGFDAVVGNPPFLGGTRISGPLGSDYRQWLARHLANRQTDRADLVVFFFLRASTIASRFGFICTNTIAQGDSRVIGLDQLLTTGWTIDRAVKSTNWPGAATVEVSKVWMQRAGWSGAITLDGSAVATGIASSLEPSTAAAERVHRLRSNAGGVFEGVKATGIGFVLAEEEAQELLARDPRNSDVLFPFLGGEDLNTSPDQRPARWIICFFDWDREHAEQYGACFQIVRERVKPQRDKLPDSKKKLRDAWWRFEHLAPSMFSATAGMDELTGVALVSKTLMPVRFSADYLPNHKVVVFADASSDELALISSGIHYWWTITQGSTLRQDASYLPTDCYGTFPRVSVGRTAAKTASRLSSFRRTLMLDRWEGLTKTYNRFHAPAETSDDVRALRDLHTELDHAVAAAYGWGDLELGHGFHETRQGVRYTIGVTARATLLDRLVALNHERYEDEVKKGLHQKGKSGTTRGGSRSVTQEPGSLF